MSICGVGSERISIVMKNSEVMSLLASKESLTTLWLHPEANGSSRMPDRAIALIV